MPISDIETAFTGLNSEDDRSWALVKKKVYEKELLRLQAELVILQEWVRAKGKRVVVVFEGRDAPAEIP